MKTKIIAIIMCLLLLVLFAGCGNSGKDENTSDTTTTTESTTIDEFAEDVDETNNTDEPSNDARLVGKWSAVTYVPIDDNGNTVASRSTVIFNNDGTFSQVTTEAQAEQMLIDTFMITFGCDSEAELESFIKSEMNMPLDAYIAISMAKLTDADLNITGTWKTSGKTLYQTTFNGTRDKTETTKFVVSDNGETAKIRLSDGTGEDIIMYLTRI